jgi:hypothetical protein
MPSVIEIPAELVHFQFPDALQNRLQSLLDNQDEGKTLNEAERQEAESLVELAEFLSLLQLRSQRVEKSL